MLFFWEATNSVLDFPVHSYFSLSFCPLSSVSSSFRIFAIFPFFYFLHFWLVLFFCPSITGGGNQQWMKGKIISIQKDFHRAAEKSVGEGKEEKERSKMRNKRANFLRFVVSHFLIPFRSTFLPATSYSLSVLPLFRFLPSSFTLYFPFIVYLA